MEIRRIRPEEWQALKALRLRALASDPDAFGGRLEDAIEHDDDLWRKRAAADPAAPAEAATFVAAAADGTLVGMAVGAPAPDHPDAAGLFGMWVAPDARGEGIGGALVDAVVAWAESVGYDLIGLGVTTTNTAAIALYERKGFADLGMRMPLREGSDLEIQLMGAQVSALLDPPSS
jgi:ribosomal protein S18 acetylase RimI-like enzyme